MFSFRCTVSHFLRSITIKQSTFNVFTLYVFRKSSGFQDKVKKRKLKHYNCHAVDKVPNYSNYQYISITKFLEV